MNNCFNTLYDIDKIKKSIGIQIYRLRIRKNITQVELANTCKISVSTLKRLEQGKNSTIHTLISILIILNKTEWFNNLSPIVSISPLDMLSLSHERIRASKH